MSEVRWAYGVTTVTGREDLLDQTLLSLKEAGFTEPRLFHDVEYGSYIRGSATPYERTVRRPKIGLFQNWILGLYELYLREPQATLYAMFQDDILICKNTKAYIEKVHTLASAYYYNLFTFMENETIVEGKRGWYTSSQNCRGAQALVFTRYAVQKLLASENIVNKVVDSQYPSKKLDTEISKAMKESKIIEIVHSPSLVQHMGQESTVGNTEMWKEIPYQSKCFNPDYDPLTE